MEKNPRTEAPHICGVTQVGSLGIEWVCVKKVHAKIYFRRNGKMFEDTRPNADRHYFVPRWLNRPQVINV